MTKILWLFLAILIVGCASQEKTEGQVGTTKNGITTVKIDSSLFMHVDFNKLTPIESVTDTNRTLRRFLSKVEKAIEKGNAEKFMMLCDTSGYGSQKGSGLSEEQYIVEQLGLAQESHHLPNTDDPEKSKLDLMEEVEWVVYDQNKSADLWKIYGYVTLSNKVVMRCSICVNPGGKDLMLVNGIES